VRLGNQSESVHSDDPSIWEGLESRWAASREKGKGVLQRACAEVGRQYFVRSMYLGECVLIVIVVMDCRTLLVGSSCPESD
jgi:hypothetical protein